MPRWDVLVVEDEAVVRGAVERILTAEGLRVAVTESAESALTHPAAGECRLVLSDLVLPQQSGLDLLRTLGERRPDLPVVIMTGYASAETMARARECGASAFLPKPFDEAELLDAAKGAMTDVSARRES